MRNYALSIILLIAGLLVSIIATIILKVSYNKYKKKYNNTNKSGYDVAREILDANGLNNVLIIETKGELADHYDPKSKCISLSTDIYYNSTIASCAVAAHECGHAIQDKEGYSFLKLRSSLVPIVNFSSVAGYIAVAIGFAFSILNLVWIGIVLEALIVLFQLITLPVEFNASKRALEQIKKLGLANEPKETKKMLFAAALTYVASLLSALFNLIRLVLAVDSRDR